ALKILSSPDTKRISPQEFDGKRILAVEEGWFMLNGEKYRKMMALEMKRARDRRAQAAFRERQKQKRKPLPPTALQRAADKAETKEEVDELADMSNRPHFRKDNGAPLKPPANT